MKLDFARWDLLGDDGTSLPILRLVADGKLVSDPGHSDCFVSPLVAAEAAWRVRGDRPGSGSWLDLAYDTLDAEATGMLLRVGEPRPRVVSSTLIESGAVLWINNKLSLAPTGEWAMADDAGLGTASQSLPEVQALEASDRPLSGTRTDEWAMASRAGLPPAMLTESTPELQAVDPELQLSGDQTAEWALFKRAIEAAGPPKGPKKAPKPAPPAQDKPLSGTGTHEWSFAAEAGVPVMDDE